jgi:hypothetical protein
MSNSSPIKIVLGFANVCSCALQELVSSTDSRFQGWGQFPRHYSPIQYTRRGQHLPGRIPCLWRSPSGPARGYSPHAPGSSEERLGSVAAGNRFSIDTKVLSITPGSHAKGKIEENVSTSLELLKISAINIEYLHVPDRATPFAETLEAMDRTYKAGKFKHFGLSNFTTAEVDDIVAICTHKGWCKPAMYQGQYAAIVRSGETQLFSTLRK